MPEIVLKHVTKRFGKFAAIQDLNLTINDGEFVTLLGPSGCGKTTTLRMIAGLETPTEGEISIGGKVVFSSEKGVDVSPAKRDVGFLFQNYALWPHMTVEQNIGFGLENLKWDKERIKNRVKELVKMLQIEGMEKRYPSELSGGQQQRVAIARTLATGPSVLFMDEPLSNLDAKLRTEMRSELKRLHNTTHATFVYVTHDQLEAMTLSTRTCLLKAGVVQQYAPPLEMYNNPTNIFAADFVGNPAINFIKGNVDSNNPESGTVIKAGGMSFVFHPRDKAAVKGLNPGDEVTIGVRPQYIRIEDNGAFKGRIYAALPSGMETIVRLHIGELLLSLVIFGADDYPVDAEVTVNFEGDCCILFDKKTGKSLGLGSLGAL